MGKLTLGKVAGWIGKASLVDLASAHPVPPPSGGEFQSCLETPPSCDSGLVL